MDLSIVIVNWNASGLLRECLTSLAAASGPLAYEIIVADNNSSDDSVAMVESEFPCVRLLRLQSNVGFAAANNEAFRQARGRFVVLLNPDTVCPPGSLLRLMGFCAMRSDVGAVGPRLVSANGSPTITWGRFPKPRYHWHEALDPLRILPWMRARLVHVPTRQEPSRTVDYVAGACFLMPRQALDTVGPLDEDFFLYFEETDWCWRARQKGLAVWYCAETEVVHLEGQSAELVSTFSRMQLQQSYRQFISKHYGPGRVWQYRLAQFCEYSIKGLRRYFAPGDRERNRKLAAVNWERAKLQLRNSLKPTPPA
ncbi:MAG: glycosyltransferase family 2 protein [Candidatus Krumholzibacteriia bacterium]